MVTPVSRKHRQDRCTLWFNHSQLSAAGTKQCHKQGLPTASMHQARTVHSAQLHPTGKSEPLSPTV